MVAGWVGRIGLVSLEVFFTNSGIFVIEAWWLGWNISDFFIIWVLWWLGAYCMVFEGCIVKERGGCTFWNSIFFWDSGGWWGLLCDENIIDFVIEEFLAEVEKGGWVVIGAIELKL